MKYKNYYEILGVNRKTPKDEIKSAYRKLAKKYHPDANIDSKEAEAMFKDINLAYNTLLNEEERKKYDRAVAKYRYGFVQEDNALADVKYEVKKGQGAINDFLNIFLGWKKDESFDIKSRLEGKVRGDTSSYEIKGENEETQIEITLEDAFFGGEKKITIKSVNGNTKTYTVNIPLGIRTGEKIRLAGLGKSGKNGGKNGDLIITVHIQKHNELIVDGSDIIKNVYLTPSEAALGTKLTIKSIDGDVDVDIPAGVENDRKIKISGKGYRMSATTRGSLVLVIKINLPKEITDEEIKLYRRLRDIESKKVTVNTVKNNNNKNGKNNKKR